MLSVVPLLVGLLLFGVLLLPLVNDRAEIVLDGVAQTLLGNTVSSVDRQRAQQPALEAAHIPRSYRSFRSQTVLYSVIAGIAAGLMSLTVISLLLSVLEELAQTTDELAVLAGSGLFSPSGQVVATILLSGVVGLGVGVVANWLRWVVVGQQSYARGSKIDASLPRTVAFMYALSRSGMPFTQVLETLADNRGVYGEAATEVNATVQQMELFGVDLQTAIEEMSNRTPSDNMSELSENLGSVLASGRSLSTYLHSQYERYKEEAEAQQEQYLELLSTFAEAYVTVLVAGPLFVITTLAVIGLAIEDTLPIMQVITYVGIPLATVGFIVYVDSVTQSTGSLERQDADEELLDAATAHEPQRATDGGTAADRWVDQRERLAVYDQLERVLGWATQPAELVLRNPTITFAVTVPVGVAWVLLTIEPFEFGLINALEAVVPPLTEAGILILGVYAVAYEIQKRHARSIEKAIPDFLDRFASVNDAGLSIVESFERVKNSDLGELNEELERTWRDVEWGSDVATALKRMDRRVDSPVVTRAVTLSTNAMATSDDVAPVLEIAADEARSTQILSRQRRQTMLTYLVVIYVAFFVFLGIMAALMISFIPAIEDVIAQMAESTDGAEAAGGGIGLVGQTDDINIAGYETLFFHVTVVQAICSGLVAGQLGQSSVKDGVKHATIMLSITYFVFMVVF